MSAIQDMPVWLAIVISAFMLLGSFLTLVGTIGLMRLRSFYDRIHAPTLGTSWGTGGVVMASMILFTWLQGRPVIHEILIGIFVTVTTPVTFMLLGRAAIYRDRAEGNPDVPAMDPPKGVLDESTGMSDADRALESRNVS